MLNSSINGLKTVRFETACSVAKGLCCVEPGKLAFPKAAHTKTVCTLNFLRFRKVEGELDFPSRSLSVDAEYLDSIPTGEELAKNLGDPKLGIARLCEGSSSIF